MSNESRVLPKVYNVTTGHVAHYPLDEPFDALPDLLRRLLHQGAQQAPNREDWRLSPTSTGDLLTVAVKGQRGTTWDHQVARFSVCTTESDVELQLKEHGVHRDVMAREVSAPAVLLRIDDQVELRVDASNKALDDLVMGLALAWMDQRRSP